MVQNGIRTRDPLSPLGAPSPGECLRIVHSGTRAVRFSYILRRACRSVSTGVAFVAHLQREVQESWMQEPPARDTTRAQIASVALWVNFDVMSFSETSPRRELRQAKLAGEASAPRSGQRGSAFQKARVTVHNKTRTTASQNRADKAERTADPTAGEVEPRIRRPSGSTSTLSVPTKPGSSTSPTGLSPARIRDFSSKRP